MATRKRKGRRVASARCQIKVICGKTRRICRDAKGRIKSNTPAGGGGVSPRRRRKGAAKRGTTKRRTKRAAAGASRFGAWKSVSRKSAVRQSGKAKGTLKPGCKFTKGGGAMCRKLT